MELQTGAKIQDLEVNPPSSEGVKITVIYLMNLQNVTLCLCLFFGQIARLFPKADMH